MAVQSRWSPAGALPNTSLMSLIPTLLTGSNVA